MRRDASGASGHGSREALHLRLRMHFDLGVDGRPERTYRNSVVQCISKSSKEAALGQSFLG